MITILTNSTSPGIKYMNAMVGKTFGIYTDCGDHYHVRTADGDWWYFKKEDCYLEGSAMPKPEKQGFVTIERRLLQALKAKLKLDLYQMNYGIAAHTAVAKTSMGEEKALHYRAVARLKKKRSVAEKQMKTIKKALT